MGVVTGDFGLKPKLYISIFGQICGGISLAIMNCTELPEILDCLERSNFYDELDKDKMEVYISTIIVLISALASAWGSLSSMIFCGLWGFKFSFLLAGAFCFGFCLVYALVCETTN